MTIELGTPVAPVPARPTLPRLREAVQACRACELWAGATQAVFGEGARRAELMLVGEQPGDREDVEGAPFVGPAGHVLDRALVEAGIDRDLVYLTNVVKHFRYKQRGKRRIHQRPDAAHIAACRPWLDAEPRRAARRIRRSSTTSPRSPRGSAPTTDDPRLWPRRAW